MEKNITSWYSEKNRIFIICSTSLNIFFLIVLASSLVLRNLFNFNLFEVLGWIFTIPWIFEAHSWIDPVCAGYLGCSGRVYFMSIVCVIIGAVSYFFLIKKAEIESDDRGILVQAKNFFVANFIVFIINAVLIFVIYGGGKM